MAQLVNIPVTVNFLREQPGLLPVSSFDSERSLSALKGIFPSSLFVAKRKLPFYSPKTIHPPTPCQSISRNGFHAKYPYRYSPLAKDTEGLDGFGRALLRAAKTPQARGHSLSVYHRSISIQSSLDEAGRNIPIPDVLIESIVFN